MHSTYIEIFCIFSYYEKKYCKDTHPYVLESYPRQDSSVHAGQKDQRVFLA